MPLRISLFIYLACCLDISGQSLDHLMSEKKTLQDEIAHSTNQLASYNSNIDDVTVKINAQRKIIKKLNRVISNKEKIIAINKKITRSYKSKIDSLTLSNDDLEHNYTERVNRLYIHTLLNKNKLAMPSEKLNNKTKINVFTRQYYESCKSLADLIKTNIIETDFTLKDLKKITKDNSENLKILDADKKDLTKTVDKDKDLSKRLKSKRKSIKKDVELKNKQLQSLSKSIRKLIKRSSTGKPTDILLGHTFEVNRGIYPSPLGQGVVVSEFGEQSHPINKNIKIFNNGVDILSDQSTGVTAIFDGIIMSVQSVPGLDKVMIIKHGNYFTVYANLVEVAKSIGDKIKAGEIIGHISSSKKGRVLHFELWKNQSQLDPEKWINF